MACGGGPGIHEAAAVSGPAPSPAPSLAEAVAAQALSAEPDPALRAAVSRLVAVCGDTLDAVLFFGSRRTGAPKANVWSAYDLFAVVGRYRPFYARLRASGLVHRRPLWLALVSHWLPPTQLSLQFTDPELHAKVSVIRADRLQRETSARRRDHFTIGRLFQPVRVEHWRSEPIRQAVLGALVSAVSETRRWTRPWLPGSFDSEGYGRRALEISMAWELRPEPQGRASVLWAAQCALQKPVFDALLHELESAGDIQGERAAAASWTLATRVSVGERLRWQIYFRYSLVRATARWLKHVVTFEDWLDYVLRKASRHTGQPIVLSPRERRWPLLFLWGRVFRYFRRKDRGGQ